MPLRRAKASGYVRALPVLAAVLIAAMLAPAAAFSSPPSNAFRFMHDADGRLKAAIDPEGDTAVYSWDAAGNLLSISRHASSKLSIAKLSPAKGEVGATVTIEGTGFSTTPASDTVKFNGTAATVSAASATSLTVKVPGGATTGSVTVSTPGEGPVTSPESFTVAESSAPHISSISPSVAAAGEEITMSGSNFEPTIAANSLTLNQSRPEMTSASSSTIKFKVPTATLGGHISVATPEGSSTGPDLFIPPNGISASKVGSTGRFSLGASKTVEFAGSEKVALLLFDGTAGHRVSMSFSESTITSGSVSIWSSSGTQIASSSFSKSEGGFIEETSTLPSTGTYTVLFTPSGASAGSVKMASYDVPGLTGSITPAATAQGTTQHVGITIPGQNARYSVTVTAGEKVSLRTNNSNFTGGYTMKWLKPNGEILSSIGFGAKENWFWDPQTFTSAGTYTLMLDPNSAYTGSVDLQLWEDPDITGQTITPSTEGGSVTSTIKVPGQRELVAFSGTASQLVTVKATESTIASGTMSVLKPDGSQLSGSEKSFSSSSSGRAELTLPTTGTYKVVIDPPSTGSAAITNGTGSVKVTVYLGSHVAWFGPMQSTTELASLVTSNSSGPPGYSNISGRSPANSSHSEVVAASLTSVSPTRGFEGKGHRSSHPERSRKGRSKNTHHRTNSRPNRRVKKDAITAELRAFRPAAVKVWHPPWNIPGWEAAEPKSPWAKIGDLQAPAGTTALAGQALERNGLPLAGVHLSVEGTSTGTTTDESGRFLLSELPAGHQTLVVDGESVPGDQRYGSYEVSVDLADHKTTTLDYTVWLTSLDRAGNRQIASPTERETNLTTPSVPGLEVRIPAGTVIRSAAGKTVKDLNITAIPVNQAPFPLPPFVPIPVYFTIQPGRAYLSKGAQIVYPNWGGLRPGQRAEFWNYDPKDRGWYVYGRGTVSADGKQVVPDPGVRVWQFTGAMLASSPLPPGSGPTGASSGDPVDLFSGLFTYHQRDLALPDTLPIDIQRTYRPADSNSYSFGIGTTNQYDLRLWSGAGAAEANLILPSGQRVHYMRTSPGTGFSDGEYKSTSTPGPFYASTLKYNPSGGGAYWNLQLTNGMIYIFGVGRLLEVRDSHGNKLVITRSGEDMTQITAPHGRWVKFTYDGSHRITELTDNGGRHVKYTYTSGRLTKVEGLGGRTTEYEYDGSGRMKAVINARGNKYLQVAYDAHGRVEKQTSGDGATFGFAYKLNKAGEDEATTITDPLGRQREVQFNFQGFPTSETEAPGTELAQTTSIERQPETGLILSETDPLGRETDLEYDSNGNVKEATRLAGTGEAQATKYAYETGTNRITEETDPLGHTTKYQYGASGELLKRTDPLGHEVTFEYNNDGQPTAITNAESETTKLGYESGDLVAVTNPLGRTTSQFVDALGRVRTITLPGGERYLYGYNEANQPTSVRTPSGAETTMEYDADGNPVKLTDPRGGETTIAYDSMDRIESEVDPLKKSTDFSYDKAGDLIEVVDRRGKVSTFEYDGLRRMATASFGVSGETAESTIEYEYNEANRPTKVNDSVSGEYTLSYDSLDRLAGLEGPNGSVGYEYDAAGRRTLMTASGLGTVAYEYDKANRLTEVADGEQNVSLGYDKANRLEHLTLPDGIEQRYGYDKAGEATSIAYKHGESTLGEIDYAYDVDGRTEAMWGSYARLALPEALKSAKYNAGNEMIEREGKELSYDADGNLTSDGSSEYSWDARGQLSGISGANSASFSYDPFGRRISKTLGGTTTDLLYDGPNVVQESVEGSATADLLTGLRPDQLFARMTGGGTDSYLTDVLGSTIALADGSAEVGTSYTYDPFGTATETGEANDNPFKFTGRENDGTGLQYNRARYYSPADARFISRDPAGLVGSGPNLYWYASGNPLNFTDPSGEVPIYVPNPIAPIENAAEDAVDHIGDWASDAPAVASETLDCRTTGLGLAAEGTFVSAAGFPALLGGPVPSGFLFTAGGSIDLIGIGFDEAHEAGLC
jgi:RHS repeat-associated protein